MIDAISMHSAAVSTHMYILHPCKPGAFTLRLGFVLTLIALALRGLQTRLLRARLVAALGLGAFCRLTLTLGLYNAVGWWRHRSGCKADTLGCS